MTAPTRGPMLLSGAICFLCCVLAVSAFTCGLGNAGDGVCMDAMACCSSDGWCGTGPEHCGNNCIGGACAEKWVDSIAVNDATSFALLDLSVTFDQASLECQHFGSGLAFFRQFPMFGNVSEELVGPEPEDGLRIWVGVRRKVNCTDVLGCFFWTGGNVGDVRDNYWLALDQTELDTSAEEDMVAANSASTPDCATIQKFERKWGLVPTPCNEPASVLCRQDDLLAARRDATMEYLLVRPSTFSEAEDTCESLGGTLAAFPGGTAEHSDALNQLIIGANVGFRPGFLDSVWLGATRIEDCFDDRSPECFQWLTGEPMANSTMWLDAQPNNVDEKCVVASVQWNAPGMQWLLRDTFCNMTSFAVCERVPTPPAQPAPRRSLAAPVDTVPTQETVTVTISDVAPQSSYSLVSALVVALVLAVAAMALMYTQRNQQRASEYEAWDELLAHGKAKFQTE